MTKINKKQFYVIAGLAGIIATAAAFAFPLQTAESGVDPGVCFPPEVFLLPDGPCIPEEFCASFDNGFCVEVLFPLEPICIPEHWDKIIFTSKKDVLNSVGEEIFDKKTIMDIKVLDNPDNIEFPMQKAADKLNSVGWTTEKGEPFTPKDLKLIDIEYAIVCVGFFDGFPNGNNDVS